MILFCCLVVTALSFIFFTLLDRIQNMRAQATERRAREAEAEAEVLQLQDPLIPNEKQPIHTQEENTATESIPRSSSENVQPPITGRQEGSERISLTSSPHGTVVIDESLGYNREEERQRFQSMLGLMANLGSA